MTQTGTVQWTAPEIFRGEVYNERIDVYSFAMFCYETRWGVIRFCAVEGCHCRPAPLCKLHRVFKSMFDTACSYNVFDVRSNVRSNVKSRSSDVVRVSDVSQGKTPCVYRTPRSCWRLGSYKQQDGVSFVALLFLT